VTKGRLRRAIQLETEEDATFDQFAQVSDRIEVLILGQSDIKAALDPERFPAETFNLADHGENFIETYHKLKRHLPEMPRLKVVVMALGPWTFSSFRTDRLRTFMYRRYIGWKDIRELRTLKGSRVVRQKLKSMFQVVDPLPLRRTAKSLMLVMRGGEPLDTKGELYRGHRRNNRSDVRAHAAVNMVRHHFEGSTLLDPHIVAYFAKTLELCRDKGLTVVMVTCPVVDLYRIEMEKYITGADLRRIVWDEWGMGPLIARHVDGLGMYEDRYELFTDQNHINLTGSRLFTDHVVAEIADLLPNHEADGAQTERTP
jgi:hypothetical protein